MASIVNYDVIRKLFKKKIFLIRIFCFIGFFGFKMKTLSVNGFFSIDFTFEWHQRI